MSRIRILLVEPDRTVREGLARLLEIAGKLRGRAPQFDPRNYLGHARNGDRGHDSNHRKRDHHLEKGEAGPPTLYQDRSTKAEPLKDGPEPLEGSAVTAT